MLSNNSPNFDTSIGLQIHTLKLISVLVASRTFRHFFLTKSRTGVAIGVPSSKCAPHCPMHCKKWHNCILCKASNRFQARHSVLCGNFCVVLFLSVMCNSSLDAHPFLLFFFVSGRDSLRPCYFAFVLVVFALMQPYVNGLASSTWGVVDRFRFAVTLGGVPSLQLPEFSHAQSSWQENDNTSFVLISDAVALV